MPRFFIILTFFFVVPFFVRAGVVFNELAWMGMAPKSGESVQAAANNEWIELYNFASDAVSLEGWHIVSEDGMPNVALSGSIVAGGYFLLVRADESMIPGVHPDLVYSYKENALGNSGEHLFLKDSSENTIDEIYASSGWPAGDNDTKHTMQRVGSNWVTGTLTPRAENIRAVVNPSATPPPASSVSADTLQPEKSVSALHNADSVSRFSSSSINAYAGEDEIVSVGSRIEFYGEAYGLKNEPLHQARYWWNFGDGETAEGRSVTHIFQEPGMYTVGLHVSSAEYSASDYLKAEVRPNTIAIARVVEGENGFVTLVNNAARDAAIGGWMLEDATGKRFIIPPKTIIAAHAEAAFANRVTGFLDARNVSSLKLLYPNSVLAVSYTPMREPHIATTSVVSVSSSSSLTRLVPQRPAVQEDNTMMIADDVLPLQKGTSSEERFPLYAAAAHTQNNTRRSVHTFFLFFGALAISIVGVGTFLFIKRVS